MEADSPQQRAARLLAWYEREKRDLPWRRTTDPWAIWVSEIMLQQTRVEAVRERWAEFVATYSTPSQLADATDDELLKSWRGLGYYRRARLLRDGARAVVERHAGSVPDDAEALRDLPGVGAYTQGAIASIAFGLPLPAIDGNVERVLARVLEIEEDPKKRSAHARFEQDIAAMHEAAPPGDLNQALMELGATVCLPKNPRCLVCPWRDSCAARKRGRTDELPRMRARTPATEVETEVLVARREGKVLARRIDDGEINAGQLCLPSLGIPEPRATTLVPALRESYGLDFEVTPRVASFRHGITKWRIQVWVREALAPPPPSRLRGRAKELTYVDVDEQPTTTVLRKALRALGH